MRAALYGIGIALARKKAKVLESLKTIKDAVLSSELGDEIGLISKERAPKKNLKAAWNFEEWYARISTALIEMSSSRRIILSEPSGNAEGLYGLGYWGTQ